MLKLVVRSFLITVLCFAIMERDGMAQLNSYQIINPAERIDLEFADEKGKKHKLADYRGKIVILNFWATWCPPCVAEMPSLNNLAETFPEKELVVLTICKEIALLPDAKALFENKGLKSLHLLFDQNGHGIQKLGIKGLPTTFVLNREGFIIGKLQGGTEWDHYEVLDLIQSCIEGKKHTRPAPMDRVKEWFQGLFARKG